MAKVYFKSFYKCKEKLQDISYIKDIFYTQVFFIWEINCKLRVASCVFQTCLSMTIITLSIATSDLGISSSIHSSNSMILRCISNAYEKSFFPSTKQTGSLWLILFRNSLTSMILVLICERSMEVGLFLKTDKGTPANTAKGFFSKRLFQNPKFCSAMTRPAVTGILFSCNFDSAFMTSFFSQNRVPSRLSCMKPLF